LEVVPKVEKVPMMMEVVLKRREAADMTWKQGRDFAARSRCYGYHVKLKWKGVEDREFAAREGQGITSILT
jgi:hypothetical protein